MKRVDSGQGAEGSKQLAVGRDSVGCKQQSEKSEMLPSNWLFVPLGNVAQYINGRAFKPIEWEESGLPIIRIQNLTQSSDVVNYSSKIHEEKYYVRNGDVLMAWSATLDVFIWNKGPAWLNQHIFNVKEFASVIEKNFLYFVLKRAISEFYSKTHGTGMVHVTKPVFEAHEIPLPPLNEQKRIVAKLDAVMPRIEAVKERLDKVPTILKRFRQSVLTAAVTGKLTEQWREQHPEVESAFQESCVEKEGLPETWSEIEFKKVINELRNGVSLKPNINPPGTKILRISANRSGRVDLEDHRFIPDGEEKYVQFLLKEGDLLFTRYNGNVDLVGVCGKVRCLEENILYPDKLMRVRVNLDFCDTNFLEYIFQTGDIRDYLVSKSKTSAGQNGLSGTDLKLTPIPLPPLEEQKEIVRQVDKLFALADKVEVHYLKAKAKVDKLSQSVLAKAFRGELVPQDPNDEPAEKLLERILEEKAKLVGSKQLSGGRKKKSVGSKQLSGGSKQSIVGS